ncbi:hypothetical protein ERO13_D06G127075v2 [Gossypium hirsutum]|nr:hypothetical protein ERO13_D06G127075v2 [Gossypium hirsutum]
MGRLVGGIGMHSPYSAGPPPNGRLVTRVAITIRFDYGAITFIGCNSHSACDSAIRDSTLVSYFLFQSLPSSSFVPFVPSILPHFPSRGTLLLPMAVVLVYMQPRLQVFTSLCKTSLKAVVGF